MGAGDEEQDQTRVCALESRSIHAHPKYEAYPKDDKENKKKRRRTSRMVLNELEMLQRPRLPGSLLVLSSLALVVL